MPTFLTLILSLLLFSCGQEQVTPDETVVINQQIEYDENDFLLESERTILVRACNALESKERFFERNYVNRGRLLRFRLQRIGCGGNIESDTNFSSEVTSTSKGIELRSVNRGGFRSIVTHNSPEVSDFCNFSTSSENLHRAERYGSKITWLHLLKAGEGSCKGNRDEACFVFSSGSRVGNTNKYNVENLEVLKVNLNQNSDSYGVIVLREAYSNRFCENKREVDGSIQANISF